MFERVCQINELTHAEVVNKQRSITRLFPPFFRRVQAVVDRGSLRLRRLTPEVWHFKIHSGTKDNVWYDAYIRFKNLPGLIEQFVSDIRLWTKNKQHVDLVKLARAIFYRADFEWKCSCPAFQYWGPAYILTQRDAKYTDPENRRPRIRNPREYGAVCKHLQVLLTTIPFYQTTIARWLRETYGREIEQWENIVKREQELITRRAEELGRRQVTPETPPEEEVPPEEREEETRESISKAISGSETIGEGIMDLLMEDVSQEEKEKWFEERTNKHIELVQNAAKRIVKRYPEYEELLKEVERHDASKFEEPERTPYISISWCRKLEDKQGGYDPINAKGYQTPGKLAKEDENKATLHHITTNSHHPEFWLKDKSQANINSKSRDKSDRCIDASRMSDLAIAEMVADWQAMSEELQKNTAREWYNKQKDVRWSFSKHQDQLIDKLLNVFE